MFKIRAALLVMVCLFTTTVSYAAEGYSKQVLPLWKAGQVPFNKEVIDLEEKIDSENKRFTQISEPVLYVYLRNDSNKRGPALLYIPGGGYAVVSMGRDRGENYAKLFFDIRFSAVAVLKYRLPDSRIVDSQEKVPLCDAQIALATLHRNAEAWKIDRKKIGVKGSSAGGHLAASLNNLTDNIVAPGIRPDELYQAFSILRVPVISFNLPHRHKGSYKRLLGSKYKHDTLLDYYSMENQVSSRTPPTFLIHATDDQSVPYENSVIYAQKLEENGIPHKYIQLNKGGHGFGLNRSRVDKDWIPEMKKWITEVLAD